MRALGDPARLAIVDTLVAGDASPGELGAELELPTNLVAHHLKVLEDGRPRRADRGPKATSAVPMCGFVPDVTGVDGDARA